MICRSFVWDVCGTFGEQVLVRDNVPVNERPRPKRCDVACVMIYIREEQRGYNAKSVPPAASPLTFILFSLDCVVTHVVDRCVLRRWDCIDTDSWTRTFPAHRNQRQLPPTCGDIFGEWRAYLEWWSRPERSSVASARRPTSGNNRNERCLLSRRVKER